MANSFIIGRAQLLSALCLPIAILLGYLLTDPLDSSNAFFVVLLFGLLSIPLLIRGYHAALIFAWNAALTPAFLPGQAFLWMPLAVVGFGFAIVNRFTSFEARFVSVPKLIRPLLFLLGVVCCTAALRGGIGLRSFGSETYGGRNYAYTIAAILGFFVLISQRIPLRRANLYISLFFLPGVLALIPNLAYLGGSSWYFLFYLFPPVYAVEQALADNTLGMVFDRAYGLTVTSITLLTWLLARYGLRQTFNLGKPIRLFILSAAFVSCAFCGFRSIFIIFILTLIMQCWLEGLFRFRTTAVAGVILLIIMAVVLPQADKLPLLVQRSISFLPVRLSPLVERSAQGSSEWRLEMWKQVLPDVPKYLFEGKGYGIDPMDIELASRNARFGSGYEGAMAAGDYHSGPLSLVIPLGIWGVIGFVWFAVSSIKFLYTHYKYGDPALKTINTLLLGYFITRLIVFIFVFGSFFSDLFIFTGIVGLSVSLNGPAVRSVTETESSSLSEERSREEETQFALPDSLQG